MSIHSTAVVDKGVALGEGVRIGPYAVVEAGVSLGRNVEVSAHAHIKGNTSVGEGTFIGTGALIGEMPQMAGLRENKGQLLIGKNNIIREYVTIHTSTSPERPTSLGDDNYLMGFVHVAHDCCLKNHIVICNGTLIAGHVTIEDRAFFSGNAVVHQFVRVGRLTMIGGLSRVNQDVPPFMMVVGDSRVWALNTVGLRRARMPSKEVQGIRNAFALVYRSKLPLKKAVEQVVTEGLPAAQEFVEFIKASQRGICGPHRSSFLERVFLDYPYFFRAKIPAYSLFLKHQKKRLAFRD
jgi:UDP-N-acetylglucosamine acyltransferase